MKRKGESGFVGNGMGSNEMREENCLNEGRERGCKIRLCERGARLGTIPLPSGTILVGNFFCAQTNKQMKYLIVCSVCFFRNNDLLHFF